MRPEFERNTEPTMDDLQPLFQIVQSSEIEDDDADEMQSKIVTNQNSLTYWTNFDQPTDYIALILYLSAIVCFISFMAALSRSDDDFN